MIYARWLLLLIPSILIELTCYLLVPIVALFVVREERTDRVKRLGKKSHKMQREYIVWWLRYFQTHDNAVDEYYWGLFTDEGDLYHDIEAKHYYDKPWRTKWVRYYFRCRWMWRNTAYGFLYNWLGVTHEQTPVKTVIKGKEDSGNRWSHLTIYKHYFLYEAQFPDGKGNYRSMKIGWKHHKGFPRVMFANRIGITKKQY